MINQLIGFRYEASCDNTYFDVEMIQNFGPLYRLQKFDCVKVFDNRMYCYKDSKIVADIKLKCIAEDW